MYRILLVVFIFIFTACAGKGRGIVHKAPNVTQSQYSLESLEARYYEGHKE